MVEATQTAQIGDTDRLISRDKPMWHELGEVFTGAMTGVEAMTRVAPWTVNKLRMIQHVDGQGVTVPGAFVVVRDDMAPLDQRRFLGVVGSKYVPFQNSVIGKAIDAICGEAGAVVETAGTLRNGQIVWCMAQRPETISVNGDEVKQYLVITNAHTGKECFNVYLTEVRVECNNTRRAAFAKSGGVYKLRHNKKGVLNVQDCRTMVAGAARDFSDSADTLRQLAETQVGSRFVDAFLRAIVPDPKPKADGSVPNSTHAENKRNRIAELFESAQCGAKDQVNRGTAYGLLNAVTEFCDYERPIRNTSGGLRSDTDCRVEANILGTGADLKAHASGMLLAGIREPIESLGGQTVYQYVNSLESVPGSGDHDAAVDQVLAGIDLG